MLFLLSNYSKKVLSPSLYCIYNMPLLYVLTFLKEVKMEVVLWDTFMLVNKS